MTDWWLQFDSYSLILELDPTNREPVWKLFKPAFLWGHPCYWCGERYNVAGLKRIYPGHYWGV